MWYVEFLAKAAEGDAKATKPVGVSKCSPDCPTKNVLDILLQEWSPVYPIPCNESTVVDGDRFHEALTLRAPKTLSYTNSK